MKLYRISAIARKEAVHVLRDPRSLGMAIAIPMLMLVLFGYALTLDVDNAPIVVWDQSATPQSRELISRFDGSEYFSIRGHAGDYQEIEEAIDSRRAMAAIVVPVDFATELTAGREVAVQIIVDGSDANTAMIAMGYARAVAAIYSRQAASQATARYGGVFPADPVEVRPRVWYNAGLVSRNYIIPGLIAVIMAVIAALLTSLTMAREWESGTMEQLLSTPMRGPELIIGKMIPYFIIGMVDVLLAVLMGEFVFHVPFRGSVGLLFGVSAVFLAGVLSVGMLISIVTKSQLLASQLAMIVTFLPSFLLSGFMYAIDNMPPPLQILTHIIPARYFIAILKGIYLKGVGLEILWPEALLLTLFGVVVLTLCIRKFKMKVAS